MNMKYFLLALLFCSCGLERGKEVKQERGYVIAMQYAAPLDGSGSVTTINTNGGVGFGSTSIHTDEKYMVVFRCEHGVVFSVDSKELYAKLDESDSVIIHYYELLNSDNVVKDLDFVDANKILK
jgi:hypothetical protein